MTREEIIEELGLDGETTLFLDPPELDEAIVGAVRFKDPSYGQRHVLVYDEEMVVSRLGGPDGDAREYFEFNTIDAWMGKGTPAFLTWLPAGGRTVDVEAES